MTWTLSSSSLFSSRPLQFKATGWLLVSLSCDEFGSMLVWRVMKGETSSRTKKTTTKAFCLKFLAGLNPGWLRSYWLNYRFRQPHYSVVISCVCMCLFFPVHNFYLTCIHSQKEHQPNVWNILPGNIASCGALAYTSLFWCASHFPLAVSIKPLWWHTGTHT